MLNIKSDLTKFLLNSYLKVRHASSGMSSGEGGLKANAVRMHDSAGWGALIFSSQVGNRVIDAEGAMGYGPTILPRERNVSSGIHDTWSEDPRYFVPTKLTLQQQRSKQIRDQI